MRRGRARQEGRSAKHFSGRPLVRTGSSLIGNGGKSLAGGKGRPLDPLRHPDLKRLRRRLRDQLDETLEAEQLAAAAAVRRRRQLRDRLLEAEDRGETAVISCTDGHTYRGMVEAVGADHVVLVEEGATRYVAVAQLVAVEFR